MDGLIGVTGATGIVGGHVAALLAERGVAQRLVVRDAKRAPRLAGAELRVASDYGAGDEMRAALEGVETLFLVPAREAPDRVLQHTTAVDAAVAAGVRRIVYLSFLGASPTSTFTLGRRAGRPSSASAPAASARSRSSGDEPSTWMSSRRWSHARGT